MEKISFGEVRFCYRVWEEALAEKLLPLLRGQKAEGSTKWIFEMNAQRIPISESSEKFSEEIFRSAFRLEGKSLGCWGGGHQTCRRTQVLHNARKT